jgi:hypothetical protein
MHTFLAHANLCAHRPKVERSARKARRGQGRGWGGLGMKRASFSCHLFLYSCTSVVASISIDLLLRHSTQTLDGMHVI